jgi:hypothetical protein
MESKWVTVGAHQMFQLKEEIKTFYNTDNVDTLLNNYGKLTIMVDGETVAEIQSIKPLTWRVPIHMLKA